MPKSFIQKVFTTGITWAEVKEKDDSMLENKNFVNTFPIVERIRK